MQCIKGGKFRFLNPASISTTKPNGTKLTHLLLLDRQLGPSTPSKSNPNWKRYLPLAAQKQAHIYIVNMITASHFFQRKLISILKYQIPMGSFLNVCKLLRRLLKKSESLRSSLVWQLLAKAVKHVKTSIQVKFSSKI